MAKDYENDENMQKRKRAARRSNNFKAGKPVDAEEVSVEETTEAPAELPTEEAPAEEAPAEEGGIVDEAEEMLAESKEVAEEETPAEEAAETPAEEAAEEQVETPAEKAPAEEALAPEEEPAYTAPEGASHDELINEYHEAIAYGDVQKANELYKQLQDHRYNENKYRAKADAIAEADAREHLAAAKELAAKYPELGEDGVAADKVLALSEVYQNTGLKPAAALRQAVADLYPEQPAGTSEEVSAPAEIPAESEAAPAVEELAPEEAAPGGAEAGGITPADLEDRMMKKRAIAEIPTASARNEPAPEPEKPTRGSAIAQLKKARGQG